MGKGEIPVTPNQSSQEGNFTEDAELDIMNASQQDILDKINTAEVEIILRLKHFFPSVEWHFPFPNQLLLLRLSLWRHKELQRSHHLSYGHQNEVLTESNLAGSMCIVHIVQVDRVG